MLNLKLSRFKFEQKKTSRGTEEYSWYLNPKSGYLNTRTIQLLEELTFGNQIAADHLNAGLVIKRSKDHLFKMAAETDCIASRSRCQVFEWYGDQMPWSRL